MKRPYIIGQAPARGNDGKPPFAGASGARLAQLAGVGDTGDVLPHYFKLRNLLEEYPGKNGKGDNFDLQIAHVRALKVLARLVKYREDRWVLLMGRNVARCFGHGKTAYLEPFMLTPVTRGLVFPHPSGINRWWNNPENEERARQMLRKIMADGAG